MTEKIAWSWSRLDTFEACPKQFYHKNVIKSVPFVKTEAMMRGERIHKHIEDFLKGGPGHAEIRHMLPFYESIRAVKWDEVLIECESAYTEDMQPTSWFGPQAWLRVKQDFMAKRGSIAMCLDHKTGKNRGYSDQLKLYAAEAMHKWKDVKRVITSYVFIDSKDKEQHTFTRKDYDHIWNEFGDRVERIQIANENNEWPAKPSAMSCRFCPVKECEARK